MELNNNDLLQAFQPPAQPQKQKRLTSWQWYRGGHKLLILSASSCLLTQVARLIPGLAWFIGIGFIASTLGLLVWAYFTDGDQRLEISLVTIASLAGIALGLRDAIELLSLIGLKHWIAAGVLAAIALLTFISEGRGNG